MWKVTYRGLLAHKARLVLTAIAVFLGVALMAGTRVLGDTLDRTFDDLFADVNQGVDAAVRRSSDLEAMGQTLRGRVDEHLLQVVGNAEGVAAVEGDIFGYAALIGKDGEPVNRSGNGPPAFATTWTRIPELNPMRLVEGTEPLAPEDVVIDKGSARRGDLAVGDTTQLLTKSGPMEVRISGIATFGSADSAAGSQIVLMRPEVAQRVLASPGQWDTIRVVALEGVSQEQLVANISDLLPEGVEAITGAELIEENQDSIATALAFFNTLLLVFVLVALFVGSFIIYNTFSIIVAQRTKELALLRAIGSSRRQVVGSVLLEALVVGAVAAVLGLLGGIALAKGLQSAFTAFGIDLPSGPMVVQPATMTVAAVVGVVVTLAMAGIPALRASRIPPVAAMREVGLDAAASSRPRLVLGIAVTAGSAALLIAGLAQGSLALVGLGAFGTFIGVAVLGPVLARPLSSALGWPLVRTVGVTGKLARANASRSPKRTAATASALMIGLGLVAFFTVFAQSIKSSISHTLDENFNGDFVIASGSQGFGGLSPDLAERVAALPEVAEATGVRLGFADVDGSQEMVAAVDGRASERVFRVNVIEGSLLDLGVDGLAIDDGVADDEGWGIGTTVPVTFAETGEQAFTVRAIYTEDQLAGGYAIDIEAYDANFADSFDVQVFVLRAEGTSMADARAAIATVTDEYPTAELQDRDEFKADQAAQINQLLGFVYLMLAIAVIIAFVGIANTLALSIIERTREIGLLRAVGMSRGQVRSSIRWEAVIIALIGTALGLAVGVFFSWAIVRSLRSEGLTQWDVPYVQLLVVAAFAAAAAVAMAILPSRRAARLDVLAAISSE